MYEGTTASIKGSKAKFDVLVGCRQGGQESPCLFNYYFDYVLKVAADEIDKTFPDGWGIEFHYNIPHQCTNREQRQKGKMRGIEVMRWILYADDVVLFCKSAEEAHTILSIINTTCKIFGLNISFLKTKTQVFNDPELASKETLFNIGDEVIENVKEFVYLGQLITTKGDGCYTELMISRATAKFNEMRKVLTDPKVNMGTRRKILESCVRSRLTYGTQACLPNEKLLKKLEVCWYQFLRGMIKGGWKRKENDEDPESVNYSFIYSNEDVQKIVKTPSLKNFVYMQHLKYLGHVCRSENNEMTKIMLFAEATKKYYRDPWIKIANILGVSVEQAKRTTQSKTDFTGLIWKRLGPTPR